MTDKRIQELIDTVKVYDDDYGWETPTASYLNNPDNFPFERCRVLKGSNFGFINTDGQYLLVNREERPFDYADRFSEGFAMVRISSKHGFIKPDGRYLEVNGKERPFDYAESFSEGFAKVQIGYNYCFIKPNGRYLEVNGEELLFDNANSFSKGFAWVKIGSDSYLLSKYGLLFQNDRDLAKRVEQLILNEFPFGSMKFYIFRKIYD